MKRWSLLGLVACSILIGVAVAIYLHLHRRPSLTILRDGKPLSFVTVTDVSTLTSLSTNAAGTVYPKGDHLKREQYIFVWNPTGGARMISFPEQGDKVVDICGRHIVSITKHYDFGIFEKETRVDQYDFTDEELEQYQSGSLTLEEIKQNIRHKSP